MVQAVGAEDDQGPVDRQAAIEQRLSEFARGIDRIKNNDVATSVTVLRNNAATAAVQASISLPRCARLRAR